eukprot:m.138267 g.138267  ORF g.138267 m.138267 type:complete len:625 (+) comp38246_c0_seq8:1428-3302(+)
MTVLRAHLGLSMSPLTAPRIYAVKSTVRAWVGSAIMLECRGRHIGKISWFRAGMPVERNVRYCFSVGGENFSVANVRESDSGPYRCQSGASRRKVFADIVLTVNVTKIPILLVVPKEWIGYETDRLVLNCQTAGHFPITLKWIRISEEGEVNILINGSLVFESVLRSDSGLYRCIAGNAYGEARSDFAAVEVLSKDNIPSVIIEYTRSSKELKSAVITCSLSAVLGAESVWLKNGKGIAAQSSDYGTGRLAHPAYSGGYSLLIQNATCSDTGVYSCFVYRNQSLELECKTMLIVKGPPEPTEKVKAELHCNSHQDGLVVTWVPSLCHNVDSFLGYEVMVTAIDVKSKTTRLVTATTSSLRAFVALNGSNTCTNCSLVYGVQVKSRNQFGTSQPMISKEVSINTATGRKCPERQSYNPLLKSLPGIQITLQDTHCSCPKSSEIYNIIDYVGDYLRNFIVTAHSSFAESRLTLKQESVEPFDSAWSGFVYRAVPAGNSIIQTVNFVSKLSSLISNFSQSRLGFFIASRCRLSFADCDLLYIGGFEANTNSATNCLRIKCDASHILERVLLVHNSCTFQTTEIHSLPCFNFKRTPLLKRALFCHLAALLSVTRKCSAHFESTSIRTS